MMRCKSIRDPGKSFELANKASSICMATDPYVCGIATRSGSVHLASGTKMGRPGT